MSIDPRTFAAPAWPFRPAEPVPWRPAELELLRRGYPNLPTRHLALALGRPIERVYAKATRMGLAKSEAFMATDKSGRIFKGGTLGQATQFKPGHASWNKGIKGSTGVHPACRRTQFKPGTLNGRAVQLVLPIGAHRVNADGYLDRKVSDQPGPQNLRWRPVHRLVWEAAHGPIPPGHAVVFRPGRFSTDPERITPDALELITRRELMLRNTVHRYGPEVAAVAQLRGALNRQINRKAKEATS